MTFLLRNKTIFFLIIFIGIIFRFYNLNFDDLWYDEIITLWVASPEHTWKESFEIHNKIELNSFIYHFFLKFFFNIFEYNEHLGRYLSATFGSASLLIIPMLLKELKLNNIRNFFIFLFSFNIFLISFSQEARLYSILFFFSILSFTYFLKIFNKKKKNLITSRFYISNYYCCYTSSICFDNFIFLLFVFTFKVFKFS